MVCHPCHVAYVMACEHIFATDLWAVQTHDWLILGPLLSSTSLSRSLPSLSCLCSFHRQPRSLSSITSLLEVKKINNTPLGRKGRFSSGGNNFATFQKYSFLGRGFVQWIYQPLKVHTQWRLSVTLTRPEQWHSHQQLVLNKSSPHFNTSVSWAGGQTGGFSMQQTFHLQQDDQHIFNENQFILC